MKKQIRESQNRSEALFKVLPLQAEDTVMLGDSLTEEAPWQELLPGLSIKNRGIGGQTAEEISTRLQRIIDAQPVRVFLMAGTNDLALGKSPADVVTAVAGIIDRILDESPGTELLVQSLLPRESELKTAIETVNEQLWAHCRGRDVVFINLYPDFLGPDGGIKPALSNDRIHLMPEGYLLWADHLRRYVAEPEG